MFILRSNAILWLWLLLPLGQFLENVDGHRDQRADYITTPFLDGWDNLPIDTCPVQHDYDTHGFHRAKYDTFENHPCRRECIKGQRMTCHYKMVANYYQTMGPECKRCLVDPSACAAERCLYADGIATPLKLLNCQYPSPMIEVCLNDILIVELYNNLTESTTIHWHGFHMSKTPESDGVPFVTQYPIQPGQTYRVCFEADRSGTVWYHSHVGWQRAEGMSGPLVVRVPLEDNPHRYLYDVDDSRHVLQIKDISYKSTFKGPNNIHINGKGRNRNMSLPDNDPSHRYERLFVTKGQCHRIRVLSNGVFNCPVQVSVANHQMLVISTDGNDIEPVRASKFHLSSGERIDFVVCADQPSGAYWINIQGFFDCGSMYQRAILNYKCARHDLMPPLASPSSAKGKSATAQGGNVQPPEKEMVINVLAEYNYTAIINRPMITDMRHVEEPSDDDMGVQIMGGGGARSGSSMGRTRSANSPSSASMPDMHMPGMPHIVRTALPDDIAEYTGAKSRAQSRCAPEIVIHDQHIATLDLKSVRPLPWKRHQTFKQYLISLNIIVFGNQVAFQANDISFTSPSISLLNANDLLDPDQYFCNQTSLKDNGTDCRSTMCQCTNVIRIPACECVEFVVINLMSSTHPFHLHGYTFRVVAQGVLGSVADLRNFAELDRQGRIQRLPDDFPAVEKDVVQTPGLGYAIIRFCANNPGYWIAHCHIERHGLLGMYLIFKIGENDQIKKVISKSKCFDYTCFELAK